MNFGALWVAPRLPAFLAAHPEVEVALALDDRLVDLVEDGLDLAIRIVAPDAVAPGLVARRLADVRHVLVASPAWLAGRAPIVHPGQLAQHPCIHLDYGPFSGDLRFSRGDESASVRVRGPLSCDNGLAIVAAVERGLGIGLVLDCAAAEGLRAGRLVPLLADWTAGAGYAPRVAYAVYSPTRHLPPKVRVLIDHLVATAADGGG